jgi:hypothetical protein
MLNRSSGIGRLPQCIERRDTDEQNYECHPEGSCELETK